jgi:predicted membrane-bound dolichyl-phosphate-mannose-protein mannosyltransferase
VPNKKEGSIMFLVYDNAYINKEVDLLEDAYKVIKEYLEENHFKSYYYNVNQVDNNTIRVDYGSHSHFFYIRNLNDNLSVFDKIK